MSLFGRTNAAIRTNPHDGIDKALSEHGSNFLWGVTAIYIVSFFICLVPSFTAPESKRVFNYILSMATLVGAITYFAQAADLGWDYVLQNDGLTRQIFYTRYINWIMTFPSLTLALGLLSGVSWTTIILNIFISWFWVLSYPAAAYTTSDYKWGFFAFGTFAFLILTASTLNECRESAEIIGISRDYMILASWTNLIWLCYPIAFALSDGSGKIGVTAGCVFFGVLDILLVPVVSVGFLILSRKWDFGKLQLDFSEYRGLREGDVVSGEDKRPAVLEDLE